MNDVKECVGLNRYDITRVGLNAHPVLACRDPELCVVTTPGNLEEKSFVDEPHEDSLLTRLEYSVLQMEVPAVTEDSL